MWIIRGLEEVCSDLCSFGVCHRNILRGLWEQIQGKWEQNMGMRRIIRGNVTGLSLGAEFCLNAFKGVAKWDCPGKIRSPPWQNCIQRRQEETRVAEMRARSGVHVDLAHACNLYKLVNCVKYLVQSCCNWTFLPEWGLKKRKLMFIET